MDKIDWCLAANFKETEAWGKPENMNYQIIWLMQNIRSVLPTNCWIKVHKGFSDPGRHDVTKSQHYNNSCTAVDYHVVGCSLLEAEAHIMKYLHNSGMIDFVGMGIYPQWISPGFHTDVRGVRASWSKINGEYIAYKLGIEFARKQLLDRS